MVIHLCWLNRWNHIVDLDEQKVSFYRCVFVFQMISSLFYDFYDKNATLAVIGPRLSSWTPLTNRWYAVKLLWLLLRLVFSFDLWSHTHHLLSNYTAIAMAFLHLLSLMNPWPCTNSAYVFSLCVFYFNFLRVSSIITIPPRKYYILRCRIFIFIESM